MPAKSQPANRKNPPQPRDNGSNPAANQPQKVCAVLLAAGSSLRFGSDKLSADLQGVPLWLQSYRALLACPSIDAVGIVTTDSKLDEVKTLAPEALFVVPGGQTRQQSSRLGTEAVPDDFDIVLIHDAARPFVIPQTVFNVVQGIKTDGAAFPAVPAVDTWREVTTDSIKLLDRTKLFAAQTPQGAQRDLLLRAHQNATQEFTDEAALLAADGTLALMVPGDPANLKVTYPADLQNSNQENSEIRVGLGYDIHSFSTDPDRPLWLGGIEFPDDKPGLEGHSDADALLHAVVDALLGALSLGDIGIHYPNTDPRWKNCASLVFLEQTAVLLRSKNCHILNIDASVLAERPKIMPRRTEICSAIAKACGIDPARVSVKATTNERLGAIGRGEGIAAFAVATLRCPT